MFPECGVVRWCEWDVALGVPMFARGDVNEMLTAVYNESSRKLVTTSSHKRVICDASTDDIRSVTM